MKRSRFTEEQIMLGCAHAFFEADAVPGAGLLPMFIEQAAMDLLQRQIGSCCARLKHPVFVPLER